MKYLLIIFIALCGQKSYGQLIKEKSGYSVWISDDQVIFDTTLAFKQIFDKEGRKSFEWQIYRAQGSNVIDTNFVTLDTLGRVLTFQGFNNMTINEYSKFEQPIKSTIIFKDESTDTLVLTSDFELDSLGRIVQETMYHTNSFTVYQYAYNGPIKERYLNNKLITREVFNESGEWILIENFDFQTGILSDRAVRIMDKSGHVYYYSKFEGGRLYKETEHYYNNELNETIMVEFFPFKELKIETYFKYIYW